jgi:hypothetical protein
VGFNSLKSLNLTKLYPNNKNNNKNNKNKVKSKPLELFELAGKKIYLPLFFQWGVWLWQEFWPSEILQTFYGSDLSPRKCADNLAENLVLEKSQEFFFTRETHHAS